MREPYVQDPPNTVKVELTEGCTLACSFCGINGIREKPGDFKFMTVKTARQIADAVMQAGWNPRIEMAMRGEPSMNPDRNEIVRIFREFLPKSHIMLTSNGTGFMRSPGPVENIKAIFASGLNLLALDNYVGISAVSKIMDQMKLGETGILLRHYPADPDANPYRRRKHDEQEIVVMPDIAVTNTGVHSKEILSNHGGMAGPKNPEFNGKICARPFREFVVCWDGNVNLCCNDWARFYRMPNIEHFVSANTIWQGIAFMAARKKLYYGERDFGPCDGCTSVSHRVGLLPDRMGKKDLPRADGLDMMIIESSLYNGPRTTPINRGWDIGITVNGKALNKKVER